MRILTQAGSRHFCQSFDSSASSAGIEVKKYLQSNAIAKAREGTQHFAELRDCLLRDAERFAFLAASNYASALRHLNAASAPWASVGFYYTAFFGARALLAMHGGWVDGAKSWIEVTGANPGDIELTYRRIRHHQLSSKDTSHRAFWTIFYTACTDVRRYADPHNAFALSPVQNSAYWLSDTRNKVNYGSASAVSLTADLLQRFDEHDVAGTLPGEVKVLRNIAKSMMAVVAAFRASNGLATDVAIGGTVDLTSAVRDLVRAARNTALDDYCTAEINSFAA